MTTTARFLGCVYCAGVAVLCGVIAVTTEDLTATFFLSGLAVSCFFGACNLAAKG